tara:strand:- start:174 stop:1649 length:1476 start_codon:yes stop_codon:yes gene_type:complete
MEFIDGKIFVNQVTPDGIEKVELKPDTERKPGIASLLGGVAGAVKGAGQNIATLLGRTGKPSSSKESDGIKEVPVFSIKDFMLKQYEDKGIQPEIEGSGFQGDEKIFVIRTPNGGTMLITQEDYFKNFGIPKEMENRPSKSMMMDTTTGEGANIFRIKEADGGRIGYQTGGITEQRTLPPEFVEAAQKTFLTDLSRQAGIPTITTAVQQQPGETAEQFANRQAQAQQFGITKAGMAELAPQVAAQDPLQAAAYAQAVDPTKGLGAFQPFLTKAGTAADAAAGLTGPMTAAQQTAYTSPFQQQVIDTTLAEFDKQAQMRQNQLAAQTLGVPGAFGGGREGVQRAEFDAASDMNRARVLADLRQRGFQQAATARQQDLANQMGIAQLQSGLGGTAQDFARAQISGLGTLGAQQQAQTQAVLDAQRQAAAMAVEDPRRRLSMFGQGISGLTPGAGTVQLMPTEAPAAGPSPLMQALGVGLAGADIYGRIFGGKK